MYRNFRQPSRSRARSNNRAYSVRSEYDSDSDTGSDHYSLKTVFVNNIDPEIPEEKLKKFFGTFGKVSKLKIKTHKEKQSYAYVEYDHPDYALNALREAQYRKVGRYEIIVMTPADRTKLRKEAKIFIKGLNEEATTREVHEFFEKISKDLYVNFSTNKDGMHLSMGYAHFFHTHDAERALRDLDGKVFQGSKLELQRWMRQHEREKKPKQNLFISGLNQMTKNELENHYTPIFEIFGEIESLVFNEDKLIAMLMYKIPEDAQDALDNLKKLEDCSNLEVCWLKSFKERAKEAHEIKNRLYLDGLQFYVNEQILKREFGQYGQITSLDLKPSRTIQREIKSKYAVIAFGTEEEAEKALAKASKNEEIKDLFISRQHIKIQYFDPPSKEDLRSKKVFKRSDNHYGRPAPFRKRDPFPHEQLQQRNFHLSNGLPRPPKPRWPYIIPTSQPGMFLSVLAQPSQNPSLNQNKVGYYEEHKVQTSKYQTRTIVEEQENLDKSSLYSNSVDVSGLDHSKMSGMELGHNDTLSFENDKQSVLLKESLRLNNDATKKKQKKELWKKDVPNSFW